MRRWKIISFVCAALAVSAVAAAPASADPVRNPNALSFTVSCPGMAPFEATVVGAVGFAEVSGQRLISIRQTSLDVGSLDVVECTASQIGTVYLSFVRRG
jgi:hypothetical protein